MIIPVYRVATSQFPIAKSTTIEAGAVVALDTNGYAVGAASNGSGNQTIPIGLAADANKALQAFEWSNRSTDYGNETAASGMLSVYHSGGEFYLDLADGAVTRPDGTTTGIVGVVAHYRTGSTAWAPGDPLYTTTTAGQLGPAGGAIIVARVIEVPAALDGGIPGEYEPLTAVLADSNTPRTWVKVKLCI